MQSFSLLLENVLRITVRAFFVLFSVGLALMVIGAAVGFLLLASLWALLRGRRPPVVTVYRFAQQVWRGARSGRAAFRPGGFGMPGQGAGPAGGRASAEVVDVEVREVPNAPRAWRPD